MPESLQKWWKQRKIKRQIFSNKTQKISKIISNHYETLANCGWCHVREFPLLKSLQSWLSGECIIDSTGNSSYYLFGLFHFIMPDWLLNVMCMWNYLYKRRINHCRNELVMLLHMGLKLVNFTMCLPWFYLLSHQYSYNNHNNNSWKTSNSSNWTSKPWCWRFSTAMGKIHIAQPRLFYWDIFCFQLKMKYINVCM